MAIKIQPKTDMAERITTGYKRLFEVRILHHYWLDEGATIFDNLPESERNKKLLNYKADQLISVSPTPKTQKLLDGINAVARQTSLGLVVAIPETQITPDDSVFLFTIEIKDSAFFNYTSFTLLDRKIVECFSPGENKIYRYKANVPVFSNLTGVSQIGRASCRERV